MNLNKYIYIYTYVMISFFRSYLYWYPYKH